MGRKRGRGGLLKNGIVLYIQRSDVIISARQSPRVPARSDDTVCWSERRPPQAKRIRQVKRVDLRPEVTRRDKSPGEVFTVLLSGVFIIMYSRRQSWRRNTAGRRDV